MSRFEPIKPLYNASSSTQHHPTSSPSTISTPINNSKVSNKKNNITNTPTNSLAHQHDSIDVSTSRALENRLKKDSLLCKQLLSSFSKQQHSLQMQEFIAGGKISAVNGKCSLLEAAKQMACHQLNTLIVVDEEGQMSGLLGYPEMRRALANSMNPKTSKVVQVMQEIPVSVQGGVKTSTAMALMVQNKVQILPMLEGDEIVGIIELQQLLQDVLFEDECVIDLLNAFTDAPVIVAVEPRCTITELAILLESEQTNAALVIDNGRMVGVMSMSDVVLRVIASGLDAKSTSVIRVMTPGLGTATTESKLTDIKDRILANLSTNINEEKTKKGDASKMDKHFNHVQSNVPVVDSADGSIVAMIDAFYLAAYVVRKEGNDDGCDLSKEVLLAKSTSFNALGWEPSSKKEIDIKENSLQRCDSRDQLSESAEFDIDDDVVQKSNIRNEPKFLFAEASTKDLPKSEGSGNKDLVSQPKKAESEPSLGSVVETSSNSNTNSKQQPISNSNASTRPKRRINLWIPSTIIIAGALTGLLIYKRIHQHKNP